MDEQNTQHLDQADAVGVVRLCLGETTQLTLGSGGGSSEDKRYVYN